MASQDLDKFSIPLIQKKTIQRTCKGPVSIKRIDPKGDYIVIENTSIRKPVVLTNWTLKRRGVDVPMNSFKFEKHFVLHPNRTLKIHAKDKGPNNLPHELMSDTVSTWGVGTYAFTCLVNHLNQEKASLLEKVEHYERDLTINVNRNLESSTFHKTANSAFRTNQNNGSLESIKNSLTDLNLLNNQNSTNYEFYFERNVKN